MAERMAVVERGKDGRLKVSYPTADLSEAENMKFSYGIVAERPDDGILLARGVVAPRGRDSAACRPDALRALRRLGSRVMSWWVPMNKDMDLSRLGRGGTETSSWTRSSAIRTGELIW
ncbi:hypothetical protein [Notoacmeibacter marinus]|uniref:hypothetical protein n=1 Tax=Notoacmeibacter marinus TaxID=1876515 RepID=UPI000DF374FF|nr:hypothetical protein [Notoacmeibacter marinus]